MPSQVINLFTLLLQDVRLQPHHAQSGCSSGGGGMRRNNYVTPSDTSLQTTRPALASSWCRRGSTRGSSPWEARTRTTPPPGQCWTTLSPRGTGSTFSWSRNMSDRSEMKALNLFLGHNLSRLILRARRRSSGSRTMRRCWTATPLRTRDRTGQK